MKISDYIRSDRRGPKAHRTELEAMRDPFLGEALEGFDSVEGDHVEALDRLSQRIKLRSKPTPKRRILLWSGVAAVAILSLIIGRLYVFVDSREDLQLADVAIVKDSVDIISDAGELAQIPKSESLKSSKTNKKAVEITRDFSDTYEMIDQQVEVIDPIQFMEQTNRYSNEDSKVVVAKNKEIAQKMDIPVTQPITIKGRVTDNRGEPIVGAIVTDKRDRNIGTITDIDGRFSLNGTSDASNLVAQFIGYETTGVTDSAINSGGVLISMNETSTQLDQVVVMGYGTSKRSSVSSSVAVISSVDLTSAKEDFYKYVEENKLTPRDSTTKQGRVKAEFRVDRQGKPYDIKIINSLSYQADKETERLIINGPRWPKTKDKVVVEINF